MRSERFIRNRIIMTGGWCLIVSAFLCLPQAALGQSGRRPVKPPPETSSTGSGTAAEPEALPSRREDVPRVASLIITGDRTSAELEVPIGYLDFAINACIDRLQKAPALAVTAGGTNVRKKEAIDKAKEQSESHIVWMELSAQIDADGSREVVINYYIFIPETGKVKNFGRVYTDRAVVGTSTVGIPLPRSTSRRAPLDYLMKQAGRDIADRLIAVFQTSTPQKLTAH